MRRHRAITQFCVFNAPFSNTRSVAELVLRELIMLSERAGGGKFRTMLPVKFAAHFRRTERRNVTIRMHNRHFTRLTNAFSKKIEYDDHSIAG